MIVNFFVRSLQPILHSAGSSRLVISTIVCHNSPGDSFQRLWNRNARTFATLKPIEMETIDTSERLRALRQIMKENKVDIYSRVFDRDQNLD